MFSSAVIDFLITAITVVLVYSVVIPFTGWFRAWVAEKVGDPTPALLGFLTLNPLPHIDVVGAILFAFVGFGWGKVSPLNGPALLSKKHPWLRVAAANYADVVALLLLALATITLQVYLVGISSAGLIFRGIAISSGFSQNVFFEWWPSISTLHGMLGYLALLIARLSLSLGTVYLFWRSFDIMMLISPRFEATYQNMSFWLQILVTFVVLLVGVSFVYALLLKAFVLTGVALVSMMTA